MLLDTASSYAFTGGSRQSIAHKLTEKSAARPSEKVATLSRVLQRLSPAMPASPRLKEAADGGWEAVSPEQRLIQRVTMGATAFENATVEQIGYRSYLERQIVPGQLDDAPLESALRQALPTLSLTPAERVFFYNQEPEVPLFEFWIATVLRSIYSPRQLFERMVVFWSDHFSIDTTSDFGIFFKPTDDEEVVRRHALDTFPALLRASAHSPAMLSYLTNDTNLKDHPNENYARELMELHTLGPDAFTEQDVKEVARCFTGWGFNKDGSPDYGRFQFDASAHDSGEKTVLGHTIPAGGGVEDGEEVLTILAQHPETARFVARKLLRYLWGYDPPEWRVQRVADTYLATGGSIPAMLRQILRRRWLTQATPKLKRPYHLVCSTVRALFASVQQPNYLLFELLQAGQLPFNWAPPNGYPDSRGYWSAFLLPRWGFSSRVMLSELGVEPGLGAYLNPSIRSAVLTDRIDYLLTNQTMTHAARSRIRRFLGPNPRASERVAQALGIGIASPDFQEY